MDTGNVKEKKKGSRTRRLLLLFHLFYYCQEVSIEEIVYYSSVKEISASHRTTMRDIQFLRNAGLIQATYSKNLKAYVPPDGRWNFVPWYENYIPQVLPEKPQKRQYMEKIIRLCTLMTEMVMYEVENPIEWYRERYPMLSDRTRQRDFNTIREIGYEFSYEPADEWEEDEEGAYYYRYPKGAYEC